MRVPNAVGSYSLSEHGSVVFFEPPGPGESFGGLSTIAVDGLIEVMEVTDTDVRIRFVVEAEEGYSVNGTFKTVLCP